MKKYLLFDLDGTLTDPKIGITTCVQYALSHFGINEPDLDKLEPFIGPPLMDSFMDFYGFDEDKAKEAVKKYRERFKDIGLFENEVYVGIPKMLKDLKKKGFVLAVASSKPEVFVKRILEHFKLDRYFDVVVGSNLDGTMVKKEEVVACALSKLFNGKKIVHDEVYMIGDRKFDVEGAQIAGVESIAVAYGYGSVEELKAAKADYIVFSPSELHDLLLRDIKEKEYIEQKSKTPFMKLCELFIPLLAFLVIRYLVVIFSFRVLSFIAETVFPKLKDIIFVLDEYGKIINLGNNTKTIIIAISYLVAGTVIYGRARRLIKNSYDASFLTHLKFPSLLTSVKLWFAVIFSVVGLNYIFMLSGISKISKGYEAVANSQFSSNILLGLICYCIITPVIEELLFRGIIYNTLKSFVSLKYAAILSAVIFGVYHGNIVQALYAFLVGLIIAFMYEYSGRIRDAIWIHMIANLIAHILTYCVPTSNLYINIIVCLVAVMGSVVSFYLFSKQK